MLNPVSSSSFLTNNCRACHVELSCMSRAQATINIVIIKSKSYRNPHRWETRNQDVKCFKGCCIEYTTSMTDLSTCSQCPTKMIESNLVQCLVQKGFRFILFSNHENVQDSVLKCSRQCSLKLHIKALRDQAKDYMWPMPQCEYKAYQDEHIKGVHHKIRSLTCLQCEYAAWDRSRLKIEITNPQWLLVEP